MLAGLQDCIHTDGNGSSVESSEQKVDWLKQRKISNLPRAPAFLIFLSFVDLRIACMHTIGNIINITIIFTIPY